MKSFEEWNKTDKIAGGWGYPEDVDAEHCYNAGAEEMRKSLRCENCKHYISSDMTNGWGDRLDSCDKFKIYLPKEFIGCASHEQKEEKR